jgi:hypothetical protein
LLRVDEERKLPRLEPNLLDADGCNGNGAASFPSPSSSSTADAGLKHAKQLISGRRASADHLE